MCVCVYHLMWSVQRNSKPSTNNSPHSLKCCYRFYINRLSSSYAHTKFITVSSHFVLNRNHKFLLVSFYPNRLHLYRFSVRLHQNLKRTVVPNTKKTNDTNNVKRASHTFKHQERDTKWAWTNRNSNGKM